jgi:hypothetical protein
VITPDFNYAASGKMTSAVPTATLGEYRDAGRVEPVYIAQHRSEYGCISEGPEQIGSVTTTKLKITGEGREVHWNVDPGSGRLLRVTTASGASGKVISDYSDWRPVDGVNVAFQRYIVDGNRSSTVTIGEYELNPTVDPKLFESPAQQPTAGLTLKVLQSQSVPYVMESGGGVSTSCQISGSTTTSFSAYSAGNSTFGTATSNPDLRMSCSSFDTTIRWRHVLNAMLVEASDGNAYIIACDAAWRWSKCTGLRPGDVFNAHRSDKGFVVQFFNTKSQEKEATYRVLQAKALR